MSTPPPLFAESGLHRIDGLRRRLVPHGSACSGNCVQSRRCDCGPAPQRAPRGLLAPTPLERWAGHSRWRWAMVALALLALVGLAGGAAPAHADEGAGLLPAGTRVGLHLASWHSKPGFENVNPGAYVLLPGGAIAGAYRNSHARTSAYAGWMFEHEFGPALSVAVSLGLVTGYPARSVMPALVPSMALRVTERWALRLYLLPKPPQHGSTHALHLAAEARL